MPTRDIDVSRLDEEFRPQPGGRRCIVTKFVDSLPSTDQDNFAAALENEYTNAEIASWLKRKGHPSSVEALGQAVGKHRRQTCICYA